MTATGESCDDDKSHGWHLVTHAVTTLRSTADNSTVRFYLAEQRIAESLGCSISPSRVDGRLVERFRKRSEVEHRQVVGLQGWWRYRCGAGQITGHRLKLGRVSHMGVRLAAFMRERLVQHECASEHASKRAAGAKSDIWCCVRRCECDRLHPMRLRRRCAWEGTRGVRTPRRQDNKKGRITQTKSAHWLLELARA